MLHFNGVLNPRHFLGQLLISTSASVSFMIHVASHTTYLLV